MIGPGATVCDGGVAYAEALTFCCVEWVFYLLREDYPFTGCTDNYVQYAWLDARCNVIDALCGYASDAAPGFVYPTPPNPDDDGAEPGWESISEAYWDIVGLVTYAVLEAGFVEAVLANPGSGAGTGSDGPGSESPYGFAEWSEEAYQSYYDSLDGPLQDRYNDATEWFLEHPEALDEALAGCDSGAAEAAVDMWGGSYEELDAWCVAAGEVYTGLDQDTDGSDEDAEESGGQVFDPVGEGDPCGPRGPLLC